MRLIRNGQTIEEDKGFIPASVRELYEAEKPLRLYIEFEREKERKAMIWASRDEIKDTISGLFLGLDDETGAASRTIAEALANDVCNDMIGNRKERGPAIIRTMARRIGVKVLSL